MLSYYHTLSIGVPEATSHDTSKEPIYKRKIMKFLRIFKNLRKTYFQIEHINRKKNKKDKNKFKFRHTIMN
jgi:hypothetical protein